jgi:hypothetical protein
MSVVPSGANRRAASAAPSPNPNCASSSTRNPPAGHHGAGGEHVLPRVVVVAEPVPRQVDRLAAGVHELHPVARRAEVGLDLVHADHGRSDAGGRRGTWCDRACRGGDLVRRAAGKAERAEEGEKQRERPASHGGTWRGVKTRHRFSPASACNPDNCAGLCHGEGAPRSLSGHDHRARQPVGALERRGVRRRSTRRPTRRAAGSCASARRWTQGEGTVGVVGAGAASAPSSVGGAWAARPVEHRGAG